jgi:hypothetical protein
MRDDPIVEETRAARRELHDEFGGDLAALRNTLKQSKAKTRIGGAESREHNQPRTLVSKRR